MVFVPKLTPYFLFNLNLILIGPNLLFSLSSRTSFSSSSVTFRFLILCGFLDWFFNPSMPYVSYRLFHLYHVALETPNAMQTSDILLPERSGSIIILYLFSIISTCYYTPRLECQPCQEAKMSTMYGSSTTKPIPRSRSNLSPLIAGSCGEATGEAFITTEG